MLLSIIISTKDKPSDVAEKTLSSIVSATPAKTEIIIIDQNQDQRMRQLTETYSRAYQQNFIYLPSQDTGLSKGRNLGLSRALGIWLLFFDDDAILEKNSLSFLMNHVPNEVLYGKILTLEDKKPYLQRTVLTKQLSILNFDSVCSIGLLIPKKIMEKIDAFDERFGVGAHFGAGEESDIVLRLMTAGIPICFSRDFTVYHPRSIPHIQKAAQYGYGIGALYHKHIYDNPLFFICLSVRLAIEYTTRFFLVIYFFMKKNKEKQTFHFVYLKNFFRGFIDYT